MNSHLKTGIRSHLLIGCFIAFILMVCTHLQAGTKTILVNLGGHVVGHDTTNNLWWNDITPGTVYSGTSLHDTTNASSGLAFSVGNTLVLSSSNTAGSTVGFTNPLTGIVYSSTAAGCEAWTASSAGVTIGGLDTSGSTHYVFTFHGSSSSDASSSAQNFYALSGGTTYSYVNVTSTPPVNTKANYNNASPNFEVSPSFVPTSSTVTITEQAIGGGSQSWDMWGTLEITATTGSAPTISGTAPNGTVGVSYMFAYTYSGSPTPTFSYTGTLPPGITLNTSTGVLSGSSPSHSGTYTGTIVATNSSGSANTPFSITINPSSVTHTFLLNIGGHAVGHDTTNNLWWNDLHPATVYTNSPLVDSTDASSSMTFSVANTSIISSTNTSGSTVGFTNPFTGTIYSAAAAGIESWIGTNPPAYTIGGLDSSGSTQYTLTFFGSYAGSGMSHFYALSGGTTYAYSAGVTPVVNTSGNYNNATPPQANLESHSFYPTGSTVTVTEQAIGSSYAMFGPLEITAISTYSGATISGTAPAGTVGIPYNFTYTCSGYPAPTYTVASGTLPPGITLTTSNGAAALAGAPTFVGTYTGTIQATNSIGTTTVPFSIVVGSTVPGGVVAAIACGNSNDYQGTTYTSFTNGTGTYFLSDRYFTSGSTYSSSTSLVGNAFDPILWQHGRTGACSYAIPVANGNYIVELGFCETITGAAVGSRVFNVSVQGTSVLSNYDILVDTRLYTPIYRTFNATVTSGVLNIALSATGSTNPPILNNIIIRTVPPAPTKIGQGEYTLFYLVNGVLDIAGSNRSNEGGLPSNITAPPFPYRTIAAPGVTFTDVSCGGFQSFGLDNTGCVWAWGANANGEMGNGTTDSNLYLPTKILTDNNGNTFNNVAKIDSGFSFGVALKNDGTVWVWGCSANAPGFGDMAGIIGNGDPSNQSITRPRKVPFPAGVTIAKVSAGVLQILALDTAGNVWSWGGGANVTERGTGNTDPSTPTKLTGLPVNSIIDIQAGGGTEYAIDSSKNLWGWGTMGGWLGRTSPNNGWNPTPVLINYFTAGNLPGHVQAVVTSSTSTHVLRDDGTVWGWGASPRGEVGNGQMNDWPNTTPPYSWDYGPTEQLVMQPAQVLTGVAKIYANAQGGSVYAVKTDGSIWSWGFDKPGYLGNGVLPLGVNNAMYPDTWDMPTPEQVAPY